MALLKISTQDLSHPSFKPDSSLKYLCVENIFVRIKTLTLSVNGDLLPHGKNEINDYLTIAGYLFEVFEDNYKVAENIDIKESSLIFASLLSSKVIEDLPEIIMAYKLGRWGSKMFSGDIAGSIAETLTYAIIHEKYDIPFDKIIPLRPVKYIGVISDSVVDLTSSKKLQEELGSPKGLLFINSRSAMVYHPSTIMRRIAHSLQNLEVARYEDNYGLLSLVLRYDNELYDYLIIVKP